jgi:Recombination endonuclease VII
VQDTKQARWNSRNPAARRVINQRAWRTRHAKLIGLTTAEAGQERAKPCEVCGAGDVVLDHAHDTGKYRGPLCFHCNLALGHAHDDPGRLEALAAYLRSKV